MRQPGALALLCLSAAWRGLPGSEESSMSGFTILDCWEGIRALIPRNLSCCITKRIPGRIDRYASQNVLIEEQ